VQGITRRRPSAALIIAVAALVVALGGTGYAAIKLPANSVGSKQIKANAVTSAKVRDGSLRAADFAAGTLLKGDKGDTGLKGDTGAVGPAGVTMGFDNANTGATITNVTINTHSVQAPVPHGTALHVSLDYSLAAINGCPFCNLQIQVGFADQNPVGCVFAGQVNPGPATGTGTFDVTAPDTPGTYHLAMHVSAQFSCLPTWEGGTAPPSTEYIGVVTVA
jgi:hypothetical protein